MKIRECVDCGTRPVVERASGRISIRCPVCGGCHASWGDRSGLRHAVECWNEAMRHLEKMRS